MAGWAAATETSAAHRRTLARAWHTQAVSTGTRVWVQASVRLREHTFRRDDELEEEDAEEKDTGYKPAAGQATQHVARLSGCGPVVTEETGVWPMRPSVAHPLQALVTVRAVAHPQEGLAKITDSIFVFLNRTEAAARLPKPDELSWS